MLPRARLNRGAVTYRVGIVTGKPVGPGLLVGLHLPHVNGAGADALLENTAPPGHIMHVVELFGRPGNEQLRRDVVMAVMRKTGNCQ